MVQSPILFTLMDMESIFRGDLRIADVVTIQTAVLQGAAAKKIGGVAQT